MSLLKNLAQDFLEIRTIPTIENAIMLATRLHNGQTDKADAPYILHVLRVATSPRLRADEERMIAILHDTIEDCDIEHEDLIALGFSRIVADGVKALSHREEEDYETYIERIAGETESVRRVKLADLDDNSNLNRLGHSSDSDRLRTRKYERSIRILEATFPPNTFPSMTAA